MASLENTILDFDLDLFNHDTAEDIMDETTLAKRIEKQRKAVHILKAKCILTDDLAKRYKEKKTVLKLSERLLTTSKEECKQICIDYRNSLDTCTKLENDIHAIQATNKQLEEKCFHAISQYEALQSHAHQLQMLIKDHEGTIESLKATIKREKKLSKDFERKLSLFEKRNSLHSKHLYTFSKILLGKAKLTRKHRALLTEYEKTNKANTSDTSHDEDSDAHENISQCLSPYSSIGSPPNTLEIAKFCEAGSVGTSIDTGRGSSLADSNDNSVDCFISNSPKEIIENKQNPKVCSVALSPIPTQMVEIATSPVQELAESYEILKQAVKVNRSTSPEKLTKCITVATSPIRNISKEVATSPFKNSLNKHVTKGIQLQEKECLENNNSKNICMEDNTELEIEMIMDVMRWDHVPITPIPDTPVASMCTERTNATQTNIKHLSNVRNIGCQEAMLCREENKKLNAYVDDLCKEIKLIKKTLHKNNINLENNEEELINSLPINNEGNISNDEDSNLDASTEIDIAGQIPQSLEKPISEPVLLPPKIITKENNIEIVEQKIRNRTPKLQIIFETYETSNEINESEPLPKTNDKPIVLPANSKIIINKKRKLSKLDKIKKTLQPKYKIKTAPSQTTARTLKKINSHKKINLQPCFQKPITRGNSSVLLNDKAIYDKAVKVMAELKRKDAANKVRTSPRKSVEIKTTGTKQSCNLVLENLERSRNYHKNLVQPNIVPELDIQMLHSQENHKSMESKQLKLSEKPNLNRLRKSSTRAEKQSNNLSSLSTNTANSPKSNGDKNQEESVTLEDSQIAQKILRSTLKDQSWSSPKPNLNVNLEETCNLQNKNPLNQLPLSPRSIITRSCSKAAEKFNTPPEIHNGLGVTTCAEIKKENNFVNSDNVSSALLSRKRCRRSYDSEVQTKRVLRSATLQQRLSADSSKQNEITENNSEKSTSPQVKNAIRDTPKLTKPDHLDNKDGNSVISYNDIDIFFDDEITNKVDDKMCKPTKKRQSTENTVMSYKNPKDSILCTMLTKYGVNTVRPKTRKVTGATINTIYTRLENNIAKIIGAHCSKTKELMNYLVVDLQLYNYKDFVTALMKYLEQPQRKTELYGKHSVPPAPAMTKSEQVLLYVISQLQVQWADIDIVDIVLSNIEYALFRLNRFPEFETIESMSHFYAVLCKYYRAKSRLRTFILDAMYCLQFKAIPLIKECLDVWMHVIPLAHMGTAKNPLVIILVYLLHFYKCEDKLNRVRELRFILSKKYFYKITEWNDAKMIETLKSSIRDLKDISIEKKMLRLALIILAKRQGPRWCQKNLITNLLQPFITKKDTSENAKEFCISMIGPLMKPYPADMKVYCEIALNQLGNIMNQNASHRIQEAVIKSMMLINRHNQHGVNQILLTTNMKISADLEEALCYYIRSKPLKVWKRILMQLVQTK